MFADLKSQSATSSLDENTHGGRRKLPFAFTEQGIAMLSSVLRSEVAVQASIRIMDTFVEMRKYMSNASLLYEKMNAIEIRQIAMEEKTERRFEQVFDHRSYAGISYRGIYKGRWKKMFWNQQDLGYGCHQ